MEKVRQLSSRVAKTGQNEEIIWLRGRWTIHKIFILIVYVNGPIFEELMQVHLSKEFLLE